MIRRCMRRPIHLAAITSLSALAMLAADYRGQVMFNGMPVPGAVVTLTRDSQKTAAVTDALGNFAIAGVPDGVAQVNIELFGFAPLVREVVIPGTAADKWNLQMLPLDRIRADIQRPAAAETQPVRAAERHPAESLPQAAAPESPDDDLAQRAADGFLINGSVNNGAASPFAQAPAFGNNRFGGRSLYNGGIGIIFGDSALDARPYSLTGQNTPKSSYGRMTGVLTFGGPIQIPRLSKNGPNLFVAYRWTRNNEATTVPALVPDAAQRAGIFATPIIDPLSGTVFPGNVLPSNRISPQARALLDLYPAPNLSGNSQYNYQVPILNATHQDALQSRIGKTMGPKDQLFGRFAFQSVRSDNQNLFGFLDTADLLGINSGANWVHRFGQRWFLNLGYQFSRLSSRATPFFAGRENVSEKAKIAGNNQEPAYWGPPNLNFAGGMANLSDGQNSFDRNQTGGFSYSLLWNRGAHNITFGGDLRRQQFNYLSQQDPRGTFAFTGALTGSDFASFLLGVPETTSIAFGNADKYLRASAYDAYFADDWRINSALTVNAGLRWEYGSPITELYDRLVNLDIVEQFKAAAPIIAGDRAGLVTGRTYPRSLVHPDKNNLAPRIGIAWRPVAASSLVVRAGYGIYYDTSVYESIALRMAQQPPLSKTFSLENYATNLFTLADAFTLLPRSGANTFAIDPGFRTGYAQNWQLSIQRDLPGALQMTASYLGIKGTRGVQAFLPNTFPTSAADPCDACPRGFVYLTSNANSTRHSAQLQVRRRLRSGLTATLQYTFSKSIDDAASLGGQSNAANSDDRQNPPGAMGTGGNSELAQAAAGETIAQNWLDLRAERALSSFDQRHLLAFQMQYTTGMGLGGGTLLGGWKGSALKDWTFATQITAGSGLPQTPIYLAPVEGTGFTGTIRPDYTGAPLYAAPVGLAINPDAYAAPATGAWGNAGRNSITGPSQFTLNASVGRTFRIGDRLNLDLRLDSTNALNHVNYTSWTTTVNSRQFGLPAEAGAMRSVQMSLRLRF